MHRVFAVAGMALITVGCQAVTPDPQPKLDMSAQCPAPQIQDMVGQPIAGAQYDWPKYKTRIVGHNQPMTMDYRPDRLTVTYGADGRITSLRCV